MTADSAFWRDLETRFQALPNPGEGLKATFGAGQWWIVPCARIDELQGKQLKQSFNDLAKKGAIAAGAPSGAILIDYWLDLLRKEGPDFYLMDAHDGGGRIEDPISASAIYCVTRETRAFESETAAALTVAGKPEDESSGQDAGPAVTRRGYRSEIRAYMKKKELATNMQAARHFGVGVDTLKSIMSSKGKPRFSEGTLNGVLKKIGYKEP